MKIEVFANGKKFETLELFREIVAHVFRGRNMNMLHLKRAAELFKRQLLVLRPLRLGASGKLKRTW